MTTPGDGTDCANEPAPPDLLDGGRALWHRILGRYDLGPHEVAALVQACRLTDRLDTYANLIASAAILDEETGRLTAVIAQERLTSVALVKVLSTLHLPDDPGEDAGEDGGTGGGHVVPIRGAQ